MNKQGTVARWDDAKGFGFIRSPQTDADVFFHVRDYKGRAPIKAGMRVCFEEIHVGGKGPRAMDVRPENDNAPPAPTSPRSRGNRPQRTTDLRPQARSSGTRSASRPVTSSRNTTTQQRHTASAPLAIGLTLLWLALLAIGVWQRRLDMWVLPGALVLNLVTIVAYWQDKHAARQGRWRTPESSLHLLGLAGGWPGAWWAQQALRHKSSKQPFRTAYWLTVFANLAALVAWVWVMP